jgi:hypothetical protein
VIVASPVISCHVPPYKVAGLTASIRITTDPTGNNVFPRSATFLGNEFNSSSVTVIGLEKPLPLAPGNWALRTAFNKRRWSSPREELSRPRGHVESSCSIVLAFSNGIIAS